MGLSSTSTPSVASSDPSATGGSAGTGPTIDATTILSLLSTLLLLGAAYGASLRFLGKRATVKTRVLFVWHLFDALIHFFLEGSFLINCFFSYYEIPKFLKQGPGSGGFWGRSSSAQKAMEAAEEAVKGLLRLTPPDVYWLGDKDRLYGNAYGNNPFALLWQEYAKADRRWGGTDLTVISLELLTVCIGAPLALWICKMIVDSEGVKDGSVAYKKWFWMIILATGELYGGFMTFAPEWLTGSPNLDTSNWMYMWLYLFFFNTLWVAFPLWILHESYTTLTRAMTHEQVVDIIANLPRKNR